MDGDGQEKPEDSKPPVRNVRQKIIKPALRGAQLALGVGETIAVHKQREDLATGASVLVQVIQFGIDSL